MNGLIENHIKELDEKIGNINSLEINIKRQNWKFWFDGFWQIEKILLRDFLNNNNIQNIIKNISGNKEFLNNKIQTINQKLEELKNVKYKLEEELKYKLKKFQFQNHINEKIKEIKTNINEVINKKKTKINEEINNLNTNIKEEIN